MALRMKDGLVDYKRGFSKRVAAFAVVFVAGTVFGATFFGSHDAVSGPSNWAGDMAKFHAIAVSLQASTSEATRVIDDRGMAIELPNLTFQTRTLATVDGADVVMIAYASPAGVPVNLFRRKTDYADLSEPVVGLRHDLQAATWTKGGIEYLLIGGTDASIIWKAAKDLSSR